MAKRALLVEVDYHSGKRAGDVDPKDPNLQSYGWQSLPDRDGPDVEIRLVEDGRDLSKYEDEPGVRILVGEEEIEAAIEEYVPPTYQADNDLLREWLEREGRDPLAELGRRNRQELLREVHKQGGPVQKQEPNTLPTEATFGSDIGNPGRGTPPADLPDGE